MKRRVVCGTTAMGTTTALKRSRSRASRPSTVSMQPSTAGVSTASSFRNRIGASPGERRPPMLNPYKYEVQADSSGKWSSNGLRFQTAAEAALAARTLAERWYSVTAWRVVDASSEPPLVVEVEGA